MNEIEINNIELEYSIPEDLPDILGAFSQFHQVFLNIIINSIQAMPEWVTLLIVGETGEPESVQIHVADAGLDIPKVFCPIFLIFSSPPKRKGQDWALRQVQHHQKTRGKNPG
jgi:signal transduction histidine kinase